MKQIMSIPFIVRVDKRGRLVHGTGQSEEASENIDFEVCIFIVACVITMSYQLVTIPVEYKRHNGLKYSEMK